MYYIILEHSLDNYIKYLGNKIISGIENYCYVINDIYEDNFRQNVIKITKEISISTYIIFYLNKKDYDDYGEIKFRKNDKPICNCDKTDNIYIYDNITVKYSKDYIYNQTETINLVSIFTYINIGKWKRKIFNSIILQDENLELKWLRYFYDHTIRNITEQYVEDDINDLKMKFMNHYLK